MKATDRVDALAADNVRLRDALETLAEYAWHKSDCRNFDGSDDRPCTCGYEDAVIYPTEPAA